MGGLFSVLGIYFGLCFLWFKRGSWIIERLGGTDKTRLVIVIFDLSNVFRRMGHSN